MDLTFADKQILIKGRKGIDMVFSFHESGKRDE